MNLKTEKMKQNREFGSRENEKNREFESRENEKNPEKMDGLNTYIEVATYKCLYSLHIVVAVDNSIHMRAKNDSFNAEK